MSEERREFAGFVQAWTQDSRNLLDQGLGSQEGIVLLSCEERTSVGKDGLSAPTPSLKRTAQLRPHCSASLASRFHIPRVLTSWIYPAFTPILLETTPIAPAKPASTQLRILPAVPRAHCTWFASPKRLLSHKRPTLDSELDPEPPTAACAGVEGRTHRTPRRGSAHSHRIL